MNTTPDLFDLGDVRAFKPLAFRPASANRDPVTSHLAESKVTQSGRRQTQAEQVLEALKRRPMHTSAELAEAMGACRFMVARRLSDLRHNNLVRQCAKRVCAVKGSEAVTWDVV